MKSSKQIIFSVAERHFFRTPLVMAYSVLLRLIAKTQQRFAETNPPLVRAHNMKTFRISQKTPEHRLSVFASLTRQILTAACAMMLLPSCDVQDAQNPQVSDSVTANSQLLRQAAPEQRPENPASSSADSVQDSAEVPLVPHGPTGKLPALTQQELHHHFIVTVRDGVDPEKLAAAHNITPRYVYRTALRGFAALLSAEQKERLLHHPGVTAIEQDQPVTASTTQTLPSSEPWGLDRIDQRSRSLDGRYVYSGSGSGVRVYVVDTGIATAHPEFGSRAMAMFDAFGGDGRDYQGHGSHVAGTIGGQTYGVAKNAMLRSVRVIDASGFGSDSTVIAGVDWIAANRIGPAVVNMSIGGGYSSALNTAVSNLVSSGVFVAVAAGNDGADACGYSPGSALGTVTVGATERGDSLASYSNGGPCVDILAPGSSILSAAYTGGSTRMSGTSMASPHVAGVAAIVKSVYGDVSASSIMSFLASSSTKDAVSGVPSDTPNRLLFQPL